MFENSLCSSACLSTRPAARWGTALWLLLVLACPLAAQEKDSAPAEKTVQVNASRVSTELLRVHAHTLEHRSTDDVVALVRPFLSDRGTVEEQPATRTLVIRDTHQVIERVILLLGALDLPPQDLRFDIQVLRAVRRPADAPAETPVDDELSEDLVEKLRRVLRYDDYQVLAEAGVSTREGEDVTYTLGENYRVSFKPGSVLAGKRLRLEGFRVQKAIPSPVNKSRRLEPRDLFHATLNLWLDRPLTLVLAQDEVKQEALVVAITCRPDGISPAVETLDAEPFQER